MLQALRQAAVRLPDPSRVAGFVAAQANGDGGLRGRSDASDLYYTVFGLECLIALDPGRVGEEAAPTDCEGTTPAGRDPWVVDGATEGELPTHMRASLTAYLRPFGTGQSLDLAHTASLARCWTMLAPGNLDEPLRQGLLDRLASFRCDDGGYSLGPGETRGSGYGCFLAMGAFQDLRAELPDPQSAARFIRSLTGEGGGYGNWQTWPAVSTPSTAAAVTTLVHLGETVDPAAGDWLMSMVHPSGGFLPWPGAPPDLLCTATAVHTLSLLGVDLSGIAAPCRDFVLSLQTDSGGFGGYPGDPVADCEFTYYALLTLGRLGG